MELSIHIPSKGRVRGYRQKNTQEETLKILRATYLAGKKILVHFSNGKSKMVDFEPLFKKYVQGEFSYFANPVQFRKFKVEGGNIFWGKDEDVIFSAQTLYASRYSKLVEDEILYIL